MRFNLLGSFALVAIFGIGGVAEASAPISYSNCSYTPKPYTVAFSNGVGNTVTQATTSLRLTMQSMGAPDLYSDGSGVNATEDFSGLVQHEDVILLYHANDGIAQDVSETLLQKAQAEASTPITWGDIVNVLDGASGALPLSMSQMTEAFRQFYMGEVLKKAAARVATEADDDYQKIRAILKADPGARILIIGHSQGTLYANGVYQRALDNEHLEGWGADGYVQNHIRVVNVGAAADRVAGQLNPTAPPQYVTSSVDAVIGGLRILSSSLGLNQPLDANNSAHFSTNVPGSNYLWGRLSSDLLLNHGYVSTYLSDSSSSHPLQKLLKNVLLEDVEISNVSAGQNIEVEIDIQSDGSGSPGCDSSCIGGAGYGGDFFSALPFYESAQGVRLDPTPGITTYKMSYGFSCAGLRKRLNLRPDHPSSGTRYDLVDQPIATNIIYRPFHTPTLVAARIRVAARDSSSFSEWRPISLSGAAQVGTSTISLPLFRYSESITPSGINTTFW